jgi:hypothetical protein
MFPARFLPTSAAITPAAEDLSARAGLSEAGTRGECGSPPIPAACWDTQPSPAERRKLLLSLFAQV